MRSAVAFLGTHQRQTTGLVLALLAYWLLAMQDATVKWLVGSLPVWQILFIRSLVVVVFCLGIGGPPLLRQVARTDCGKLLLWRGFVALSAWLCFFTAA